MNIFMMLLVVLFMAGYYFMGAPSQVIKKHETEFAVNRADLRSVVECASSAHYAVVKDTEFTNICVQKYNVVSTLVCLNESLAVVNCDLDKTKKPKFNFIVTSTGILPDSEYNNTIEILEEYYPTISNFGVFMDGFIISGNNSKRSVSENVIKTAKLETGQLVYITQFDIPDIETSYQAADADDLKCNAGTVKVYRFSRWQCIATNDKSNCPGDTIWDSDLLECVADDSRKPLCSSNQTAVLVDDVWECLDPISNRTCDTGQTAKLNYSTLEWQCIDDPTTTATTKSCDKVNKIGVYGTVGNTLQIFYNYCTDCEKMITDTDTCETKCVPDPDKLNDSKCYANAGTCTGDNRGFYFGFPNSNYTTNVTAVSNKTVTFDSSHSTNRMFNCLDCGNGEIDTENSYPPYIAVCK